MKALSSGHQRASLEKQKRAGMWLKRLREEACLSTEDLAFATANVADFIRGIECGAERLPTKMWSIYAAALGIQDRTEFGKQLLALYDDTMHTLLYGDFETLLDRDWSRETERRTISSEMSNQLRKVAGAWLRDQRRAAGLSRQELADMLELKERGFVALLESGRVRLPRDRYKHYARAMRMDPKTFTLQMNIFDDHEIFAMLFDP